MKHRAGIRRIPGGAPVPLQRLPVAVRRVDVVAVGKQRSRVEHGVSRSRPGQRDSLMEIPQKTPCRSVTWRSCRELRGLLRPLPRHEDFRPC